MFPPSTGSGRKRASLCPFRLSDLREIKKDLDGYTDAPDQYIQAFISVIQTFELAWKDIMLLLRPDSFLIRKATGPGPSHLGWGRFPSTTSPNTRDTWK
jgi:hypothetical protein